VEGLSVLDLPLPAKAGVAANSAVSAFEVPYGESP
jgi:hypothetical protein